MKTKIFIMAVWVIGGLLAGWFLGELTGCSDIIPQTQSEITTIHNQGAINDAKGETNPGGHPLDAGNATISFWRSALAKIFLVTLVALGLVCGLYLTPLSYLNTFAVPMLGGLAVLSFIGAIAVSFGWWLVAPAVALVAYEIYVQVKPAGSGILGTIESFFSSALSKIETVVKAPLSYVEGLATELYDLVTGKKSSTVPPASPASAGMAAIAPATASAAKP